MQLVASAAGGLPVHAFPPPSEWAPAHTLALDALAAAHDHLSTHCVAVERAGRAADGGYYTMRGLSMAHLVAPIDELLTAGTPAGVSAGRLPTPPSVTPACAARCRLPPRPPPQRPPAAGPPRAWATAATRRAWGQSLHKCGHTFPTAR